MAAPLLLLGLPRPAKCLHHILQSMGAGQRQAGAPAGQEWATLRARHPCTSSACRCQLALLHGLSVLDTQGALLAAPRGTPTWRRREGTCAAGVWPAQPLAPQAAALHSILTLSFSLSACIDGREHFYHERGKQQHVADRAH